MNSDSNSDSEQCTESKLGRVHRVHTLNPSCARIAPMPCAQRRVVAHWASCRGRFVGRVTRCVAAPVVPCRCSRAPCPRAVSHALLPCHSSSAPCHRALLRHIAAPGVLCRDARPPSYHDTNDCIVTHLSGQAPRARSPLAPCVGRLCRARGWPYRSPAARPSMHPLCRIVPWRPCCVTIQYVVS